MPYLADINFEKFHFFFKTNKKYFSSFGATCLNSNEKLQ